MNGNLRLRQDAAAAPENAAILTPGRILFFLVLAAVAIRVMAALTRQMIQLDEANYVSMAKNLAAGLGPEDITRTTATHFSPLLPLFIAGAAVLTRSYVFAAYAVVTVFGGLILIPTYLLGAELASRRVGLMAAALMAVTPLFVDYSSRVYSESVYIFFMLMGIVFGYRMLRDRSTLAALLAGAAVGLAYLTNPSGIYYAVALAGLAVAAGLVRRAWRPMLRVLAAFLLVFMVCAAPYVLFLHGQLGKWTYDGKMNGGNIYSSLHNISANTFDWDKNLLSLNAGDTQLKVQTLPEDDLLSFFVHHPVSAAKVFVRQSDAFYARELAKVIPLWLLPLLGLGLFASGWSRRRALNVGYLLLMMGPVVVILAMYAHDRFFMPFLPLVMIWVAEGWSRLAGWGQETVSQVFAPPWREPLRRWAPWLIGAAVLLPLLVFSAYNTLRQSYPVGYRDAGEYIRQAAGGGKRVMSREYSAAFYANGTAVLLPYAAYDRTTDYARKEHVDFLVIGSRELADWRPALMRLARAGGHPEWKLVDRELPGTDKETLVFQLQPA